MRSKLFLLVLTAICSFFAASANAQTYAITNAKIVTVSGSTIDRGTVIIRNGLIDAVGANLQPPADAQVFDATGMTVYPGFIDALTNVGMPAAAARPAGQGGGGGGGQAAAAAAAAAAPTSNSNYQAGLRPEDAVIEDIRAGEAQFDTVRNAGITTVLTTGRTGIFNGQSAVINLAGDSVSAMVVKAPFAEHISFATTPGQFPQSLLGTFAALRQIFLDAKRLQELEKQYAANPKGMKRPPADKSLEALYPAINRQMPVVFNANTEIQIIRALDLIKEFNLNGIIAGGLESYATVDRLKAAKVPVLLSLNLPKRTAAASPEADPDSMETLRYRAEAPKSAGKLAAAGVKFAFQSGGATAIGDFFTNAGKAVEGGLSKDAAIRAMTLGAAELLGVDDRLGSIEPGKIANVVVVKGDIFGRDKFVPTIFVDGKVFEQKEAPRAPGGGRFPGGGGPGGGGTTPPAAAGISGSYAITIEIPGQAMNSTLNLNQQGGSLTGTMVSPLGTTQINNGRATADGFSFSASVPYGGANVDITMNGKINGNQISGTLDSALGSIPFSGTKNPQGGER
ncbi:MAG: amidohydrolase family protein [Pyrinomonadaceae bacterium]